jgi:hypothetical protein
MTKAKRRINFVENLVDFISSKPPTVVFVCCLFSFIVVLVILSDFVKHNEIRNIDEEDWNTFREKMTEFDFCVKYPSGQQNEEINVNINAQILEKNLMSVNFYFFKFKP